MHSYLKLKFRNVLRIHAKTDQIKFDMSVYILIMEENLDTK